MKRTIYIVEDNVYVREALVMLIEDEPDLEICGIAETAREALEAIPDAGPDLVLTDNSLPGMSGIELIERLGVLLPGQPAAMLSAQTDPACAEQALLAGAKGFILKGDALAIMQGIRQILNGAVYVSQSVQLAMCRQTAITRSESVTPSGLDGSHGHTSSPSG